MKDLKALRAAKGFVKCKHCGCNNSNQLKYCKHCGHRLEGGSPSQVIRQTEPKGSVLNHCKKYVETRLKKEEIDNQIIPVEGVNLSVMALLAEEEQRKRKRNRMVKQVLLTCCVAGGITGAIWIDQQDLRAAKVAYANNEMDTLIALKKDMDLKDWQKFEQEQVSEVLEKIEIAKLGKGSAQSITKQIKRLLEVVDQPELKTTLKEQSNVLDRLVKDEAGYQKGLDAQADGDSLGAYKSFLSVSNQFVKSKEVQQYLDELKSDALKQWKRQIEQDLKKQKYEEVVEEATHYLSIQSKDANVVAMKKQAENKLKLQSTEKTPSEELTDLKAPESTSKKEEVVTENEESVDEAEKQTEKEEEQPEPEEETTKEEGKEVEKDSESEISYRKLKNNQTIRQDEVVCDFVLNRITQAIWPERMNSNANVMQAKEGQMYFIYLFEIENEGSESIKVLDLIKNAEAIDGDGNTYRGMEVFYLKNKETVAKATAETQIKSGQEMTLHVAIPVPKELKTKVTPITARIQLGETWYQKEIPAQ